MTCPRATHRKLTARTHGQVVLARESAAYETTGNVMEGNREDIIKCCRNPESEKNTALWTPMGAGAEGSRARGEGRVQHGTTVSLPSPQRVGRGGRSTVCVSACSCTEGQAVGLV